MLLWARGRVAFTDSSPMARGGSRKLRDGSRDDFFGTAKLVEELSSATAALFLLFFFFPPRFLCFMSGTHTWPVVNKQSSEPTARCEVRVSHGGLV